MTNRGSRFPLRFFNKREKPFHLYAITGFLGSSENIVFYSNESANVLQKVTHWRPIELK